MKRVLTSLMFILTMALSVTVATASDYTAVGAISSGNGWSTSGTWVNVIQNGTSTTDSAYATHPVTTGISGQFSFTMSYKVKDAKNMVKAGIVTKGGVECSAEYNDGSYYFNTPGGRVLLGGAGSLALEGTYYVSIYSTDGKEYDFNIGGYSELVTVNDVPAAVCIGMSKVGENSSLIYTVAFTSPGPDSTPSPTGTPSTPAGSAGPSLQDIRDFYASDYYKIYSPYDIITYDGKGGYTVTPSLPAKKSSTFSLSGIVQGSADDRPVSGATVVLDNAIQKADDKGEYKFSDVKPGKYDVAVSAEGYASQTKSIDLDDDAVLNFALDVASAGTTKVASAANETANMTANATATPAPSPTQTRSPGFETVAAALAVLVAAGALAYPGRKR